jgi:DNA-nicking Smr family endonuclease
VTKYDPRKDYDMSSAFVKIDLHGLRQEEAMKVIDRAIASAGPATYQLQLIHGYNRGTNLRSMIYDWYRYEPKVKRIIPGDNPGITVLVLKELY